MSKRKLKKRIRKGTKRAAYWVILAILWVAKTLHLPPRLFPGKLARPSRAFGFKTVRDRHLNLPEVIELFAQPAIADRLAQLMGPDLQIWRSQVFNQEPGAPAITWHQATTYMLEDYQRPILEPVDRGELFQLTTWIAVDRATIDNGCVQFIPGTHWQTSTVKLNRMGGFYAAHFELEHQPDPEKIVSMELEPGQFVIFSERVIHGSPGNRSKNRRMGINFRTVQPSTAVYRDHDEHYAMHLEETYKLDHWGVVMLRGEDRFGDNRVASLPNRERIAS